MRRSTLCLSLTMLCATIGCSPRQSDRGDAAGNVTNETGTARSVAAVNPADAAAATALAEHSHLAEVKADMAQAVAYGIQGVPFFVIDDRYGISGAQETAHFVAALRQAAAERAEAPA